MITLYKDSDNLIWWKEMKLASTGAYITTATVTMTLRNITTPFAPLAGASALSMPYIATTVGHYAGIIPYTVALVVGTRYLLDITAISGSRQCFRRIVCETKYQVET